MMMVEFEDHCVWGAEISPLAFHNEVVEPAVLVQFYLYPSQWCCCYYFIANRTTLLDSTTTIVELLYRNY